MREGPKAKILQGGLDKYDMVFPFLLDEEDKDLNEVCVGSWHGGNGGEYCEGRFGDEVELGNVEWEIGVKGRKRQFEIKEEDDAWYFD